MTTDDADRWSVRRRIEQIGFVELGRRFGLVTVAGLEAIRAGGWPAAGADPEDEWIDGYCGEDSSDEEFFVMILAALSAVRGHEGATWCIADRLMDELVGRNRSFALRFHEERARNEDVEAAFAAMHNDLDTCGIGHGWWADNYPDSLRP